MKIVTSFLCMTQAYVSWLAAGFSALCHPDVAEALLDLFFGVLYVLVLVILVLLLPVALILILLLAIIDATIGFKR